MWWAVAETAPLQAGLLQAAQLQTLLWVTFGTPVFWHLIFPFVRLSWLLVRWWSL